MPRWTFCRVSVGDRVSRPARADDDITRAPRHAQGGQERRQGERGRGPRVEGAREQGAGPHSCPRSPHSMRTTRQAANWLRTAVDAIAEGEKAAGKPLPADKLEAFAKDTTHAPAARRLAYELLVAQDPAAKDRLLPGFLNDISPDLRRDAIARQLAILERLARPTIKADLGEVCSPTPAIKIRWTCSRRRSRTTAER